MRIVCKNARKQIRILLLQIRACSPAENDCYQQLSDNTFGCRVSCTGLFADINDKKTMQITKESLDDLNYENNEERQKFDRLLVEYGKYKTDFLENIKVETIDEIYIGHSKSNYSK